MDMSLLAITLLSLLIAATMGGVAWRMLRAERRRSAARVAVLAAEIHDEPVSTRASSPGRVATDDRMPDAAPAGQLFASTQATPTRSPLILVATVGALIVGMAVAAGVLFSPGNRDAQLIESESRSLSGRKGPRVPAPLELVALGHERDAEGLTVRGVLRNPPTGSEVSDLMAVVLVFNREGGYIASGRAAVQASTLGPGGETTFVVTVSGAPDVERYRVSFRTEHDVVPHLDHRS